MHFWHIKYTYDLQSLSYCYFIATVLTRDFCWTDSLKLEFQFNMKLLGANSTNLYFHYSHYMWCLNGTILWFQVQGKLPVLVLLPIKRYVAFKCFSFPLCFIFELVSEYPALSSTNEKKNTHYSYSWSNIQGRYVWYKVGYTGYVPLACKLIGCLPVTCQEVGSCVFRGKLLHILINWWLV